MIICCWPELVLTVLALWSQKVIELVWATQLNELLNLEEIKGNIIHLWFFGVLRETMQGERMVKSGYSYAFPLHCVKRDRALWKNPVRKHVGQAWLYLSVESSSSTCFCLLLSACLQQEFAALAAQRATQVPGNNQSFCWHHCLSVGQWTEET